MDATNGHPGDAHDFDVIVLGGSVAGSATAVQLLRSAAERGIDLRVLVVERQDAFGRRVGESTVELSTHFLTRVLGLSRHLNERHLVKQGFRYWFTNADATDLGRSTELGGRYLSRVGSFQVDRAVLDEELLRRVEALGGEIERPASVRKLELGDGGTQRVTVKIGDEERTLTARWVVDATGRQAMVARQRDDLRPTEGHPTAAVWARWKNTLDLDHPDTAARFPGLGQGFFGTRNTATNHLMGDGWWAWVIPLPDGQTSVGVTWDRRLFTWPRDAGGTLGEQLRSVLETHPAGRALLEDAELVEADVHIRRDLPYRCATQIGDGFLLVGDAAGFIDPFYSMGLDLLSITSVSGVGVILDERQGKPINAGLRRHNAMVGRTVPRWFEAIFRDKYVYMGDYELMRVAFRIDIALYYFGIVMPPYRRGKAAVTDGMFFAPPAVPFYWFMRWANRRLAAMGASRRRRGTFGRRNADRRELVPGFAFDTSIPRATARALWALLKLELGEGWRSWRPRRAADGSLRLTPPDRDAGRAMGLTSPPVAEPG